MHVRATGSFGDGAWPFASPVARVAEAGFAPEAGEGAAGWTVPLGGGFGRVMRIGSQPVNIQLQGFYNVEKPAGVGEWSIRFQIQLLFPTG